MLNTREKQSSRPSQGGIMHLGSVRVEQEEAGWQRASSGHNPADGMHTNYALTDGNPLPLQLPICMYELTQLTNLFSKKYRNYIIYSLSVIYDVYLYHNCAICSLFFSCTVSLSWHTAVWSSFGPSCCLCTVS